MKTPIAETARRVLRLPFYLRVAAIGACTLTLGGCEDATRQATLGEDARKDGFDMVAASLAQDTMTLEIDNKCYADVRFRSFFSEKRDEYRAIDYTLEASPLTTFRNRSELVQLVGSNICAKLEKLE